MPFKIKFFFTELSKFPASGMGVVGHGASLVAQAVKNLPAVQETQVQSLGWEDSLEKGMAEGNIQFSEC